MGIGTLKRHRVRIAAKRAAEQKAKQKQAKPEPAEAVEQHPRQAEFGHDERRRRR